MENIWIFRGIELNVFSQYAIHTLSFKVEVGDAHSKWFQKFRMQKHIYVNMWHCTSLTIAPLQTSIYNWKSIWNPLKFTFKLNGTTSTKTVKDQRFPPFNLDGEDQASWNHRKLLVLDTLSKFETDPKSCGYWLSQYHESICRTAFEFWWIYNLKVKQILYGEIILEDIPTVHCNRWNSLEWG